MPITGQFLIGSQTRQGAAAPIKAINPSTGETMEPGFHGAVKADLDEACALAAEAFRSYSAADLETRARFLETIADNIMAIGDELLERCQAESGLPRGRLEGERGRTVGQLRFFAGVVRDGGFLDARIDPAQPDRKPLPRVDLRLRNVGVGPVAVFSASNFPLAFSVAGGDTASALAAGCPVIAKAHSAHPGTSELVGRAVQKAVKDCGLHEGVFSLLFDSGREIGQGLVADPRIAAVGFTGSRGGGTALMQIAANRPVPIPVYAEMSSINPVVLFPGALKARGTEIAKAFVGSLTLGAGQFCTNPGLLIAVEGPDLDQFVDTAAAALSEAAAATMLTPGIHSAYSRSVDRLSQHPAVKVVARGREGDTYQGQAGLFATTANEFTTQPELQEEVFGAAGLVVKCPDFETVGTVLANLEGQLTAALHIDEPDYPAARELLPLLESKAGRVLVNGFGTGVEVSHAMVHGGPYPSTSDGRSTSVGSLAIYRFLRPVSYQDFPEALLPEALQEGNPLGLWRRVDGTLRQP